MKTLYIWLQRKLWRLMTVVALMITLEMGWTLQLMRMRMPLVTRRQRTRRSQGRRRRTGRTLRQVM